jgi:SRSO17 transposase
MMSYDLFICLSLTDNTLTFMDFHLNLAVALVSFALYPIGTLFFYEPLAETKVKAAAPQAMQRLLYQAHWDSDLACRLLRRKVVARLGYAPGVGVIDESAFVKHGDKSAGVGRQYCGRLGKVENCQVGVFLGYVAPLGYAFLDRELYLPKHWWDDAERRAEAKVPSEVTFATKPELAQKMLERAWAENIRLQWVVTDSTYGNSPDLDTFIDVQNRCYVMEVPKTFHVRLADGQAAQEVCELVKTIGPEAWRRLALGLGEKGPNFYDWTALRVTPTTDEVGEQWLLIRRSLSDSDDVTYYVSNAPADISLETLAAVASSRWCVEQMLEEAKGDAGMDDYEVRYWHSWHRHITLSMVAHTWLTLLRHEEREKKSSTSPADLQFCRTAQVT